VALEEPLDPQEIKWRVTNTTKDRTRGQVMAHADPRAYTDRLKAIFTVRGRTGNQTDECRVLPQHDRGRLTAISWTYSGVQDRPGLTPTTHHLSVPPWTVRVECVAIEIGSRAPT
jgi:hypothetical protein